VGSSSPILDRWPPVYDADDLKKAITGLTERGELFSVFYSEEPRDVLYCQGDVLRLTCDFPYIADDGKPATLNNESFEYWLLLSNTCDLHRDLSNQRWAQLVPLVPVAIDSGGQRLAAMRRYSQSREFYLPDWTSDGNRHFVAALTMPVTVDRRALADTARHARLSRISWILLHSCLVRFLARDDGRYDG
jgi:hypothetical protein